MSANVTPIFVGSFFDQNTAIAAADGVVAKDIMAVSDLDQRVDVINLSTDDTAAKLFNLLIHDGVSAQVISNFPTVAAAGTAALGVTASLNVLAHANMAGVSKYDTAGNRYILVPAGSKLQIGAVAALTTGKTAWVYVQGGRF